MNGINLFSLGKIRFVAILMFTSGIVIHAMRLITGEQPSELVPIWFDQLLVVLSFYTILGILNLLLGKPKFRNSWITYFLIFQVVYLLITLIVHLSILNSGNNSGLNQFPQEFSLFIILVFVISIIIYLNLPKFVENRNKIYPGGS